MIKRQIFKTRNHGEHISRQSYEFALLEKYLSYRAPKKNPMHHFLRKTFLGGVPMLFNNTDTKSASSTKDYIAVDKKCNRIYKENKPVSWDDVMPFIVTHYPNCTHHFSQMCLESQGFVDKTFVAEEGKTIPNAMNQHENVQNYFLNNYGCEAIEVPVWDKEEGMTGFIDLLTWYKGRWFILDYKPQATQAKNKFAVSQLLKYRDLLSQLTGITNLGCAYFDERDTFILNV